MKSLQVHAAENEIYAGDTLTIHIELSSVQSEVLRLVAVQFAGFITCNSEYLDEQRLSVLSKVPSYLNGSSLGGGSIVTSKHHLSKSNHVLL